MDDKYNLEKLRYDKEKIEALIARQTRRIGNVFPKEIEHEFWAKNLERARKHVEKYVWSGVLVYFIFFIIMISTDYWMIDPQYFADDFVRSIISLVNGGLCLLMLFFFAYFPKLRAYFVYAGIGLMFWATLSTSWLTMTAKTIELQHQAMAIIGIIYILSYILTGIKPIYLLFTGLSSAVATIILFFILNIHFNTLALARILLGSCLLGFVISHMIFARERMIYLYALRTKISEKMYRIYNSELLHLSQHDELTKISNRRTLDETLDLFLQQTRENESALSVLFIDVDFFKKYNDFYGHQKGDKVISAIAKSVKNAIRHMDFVARYGGEEFVVLLPETNAHGAYAVASNIYQAIERLEIEHEKSSISKYITISLGITVYQGEAEINKDELLAIADQALYRAKALGRNQIYYQSIRAVQVV